MELTEKSGKEIDDLFETMGKWSGLGGMSYILHRISPSTYIPHLPMLKGKLDLDWPQLYSIALEDFPPSATVTKGVKNIAIGNLLHYGSDLFKTSPENFKYR